jgi:hypothetical protein
MFSYLTRILPNYAIIFHPHKTAKSQVKVGACLIFYEVSHKENNLEEANLEEAYYLTIDQLSKVKTHTLLRS